MPHSFYAVPIPNGTLTFDELLDEAMDGKSVEPSIAKACVTEFMKAVKRNVLKGFRCQLGDNFLTVYPNIQLSVKDTEDPQTHALIVATAEMLNAANGKSRLGCTPAGSCRCIWRRGHHRGWRQPGWRQRQYSGRGAGGIECSTTSVRPKTREGHPMRVLLLFFIKN